MKRGQKAVKDAGSRKINKYKSDNTDDVEIITARNVTCNKQQPRQ